MEARKNQSKKAVALGYTPEEDNSPRVLASGCGELAERIIEIGKNNKIPFYSDKNLVEALINLQLNAEIPVQLYEAVARVLAFVYTLDQEKKNQLLNE